MSDAERNVKMIIAGGGTGGHLFPGIAVAEEFLARSGEHAVLFVGTEKGLEKKVLKDMGYDLRTIDVAGIKGKQWKETVGAFLKLPRSIRQAMNIIRDFSPDLVFGVGGYASGPVLLAARVMGIRTAIAEQNAIPGVTNRILGRLVDRIFLSFPETKRWFPGSKTVVSGNPVRAAFLGKAVDHAAAGSPRKPGPLFGARGKGDRFTILIFGGSQGARAINRAVTDALPHLEDIKSHLSIIHQTGDRDLNEVSEKYRALNFDAEMQPFITDMSAAYRTADVVICRAGATTIAELTVTGKASILIPFPFAVNDHQTRNAEILVAAGAAEMIKERELNGAALALLIKRLYNQPELIMDMEVRSAALGNSRAAAAIVNDCLALAAA